MLQYIKILLILAVAAWGIIGGVFNLLHWESGTLGSVGAAVSMATFEGGPESWQATSNPLIIWLGAIFIAGSKLAAGAFCLIGAQRMWQTRSNDAEGFRAAKQPAMVGCGIALLMLFGGFIVVGDTFFEMWRSEALRTASLDSAFRYGGFIALIAIFTGMNED